MARLSYPGPAQPPGGPLDVQFVGRGEEPGQVGRRGYLLLRRPPKYFRSFWTFGIATAAMYG